MKTHETNTFADLTFIQKKEILYQEQKKYRKPLLT